MRDPWNVPALTAIVRVKEMLGVDKAKEVVRSFGVQKFRDIPKERHGEVIAKCNSLYSDRLPKKFEKWKHHNGIVYTVDCLANTESISPEYPTTVVYIGPNGKVWAKTLDNFLQKMTRVADDG